MIKTISQPIFSNIIRIAALLIVFLAHPQKVMARECILGNDFSSNQVADIHGDKWAETQVSLPTNHNNDPNYLNLHHYGTWKTGSADSFTQKTIDYLYSWIYYLYDQSNSPTCELDSCFINNDLSACLKRGSVISSSSPRPCILEGGVGIIGAITTGGAPSNDNTIHTFFAHPNEVSPEGISFFSLFNGQEMSPPPPITHQTETIISPGFLNKIYSLFIHPIKRNKYTNHTPRTDATFTPHSPPGTSARLYLKLLDNYSNNSAGYHVRISTPSIQKNTSPETTVPSFFSSLFRTIESIVIKYNKAMFYSSSSMETLRNLFTYTIVLYIAISGAAFMAGFMPHKKEDMLKWLAKTCLAIALIQPETFAACIDVAESIFIHASRSIADSIMQASMREMHPSLHEIPNGYKASMLDTFDYLFYIYVLNSSTHLKILSLLSSKFFAYVPLIYFAIITFFLACIRSVMLYTFSICTLILLLSMAPIMLCLMLFKSSKKIPENWVRAVINLSILNIFISATMGLFAVILLKYSIAPFQHSICSESIGLSNAITRVSPQLAGLYELSIWKPVNLITLTFNSMEFLLIVITFRSLVDHIPQIVESISPALYYYPFIKFNEKSHALESIVTNSGHSLKSFMYNRTKIMLYSFLTKRSTQKNHPRAAL